MAACPECGGKMSGMAESCPHCGFAMKNKQALKQKQKEKQREKAGKCLLIGVLWLGYSIFMIAYHVNLFFCLVPFALTVGYAGRSFLIFIKSV